MSSCNDPVNEHMKSTGLAQQPSKGQGRKWPDVSFRYKTHQESRLP